MSTSSVANNDNTQNSNVGNSNKGIPLNVMTDKGDDGDKVSVQPESLSSDNKASSSKMTLENQTTEAATTVTTVTRAQKKTPNDFIFGKLLGEGSFSSVYLAKDVRGQREYAIKVCDKKHILKEKKAESIQREKEVMTVLSNNRSPVAPYFVHLYATFQDPERLYFVMTYGSGGELLKLLNSQETFSLEICKFYAGEILQALSHLHNLRIVHRDLKPENILLNADGHILITDFGSSKILPPANETQAADEIASEPKVAEDDSNTDGSLTARSNSGQQRRTRQNSFVGTAQYVSPEVLQGKYEIVGPAADLWAFGCVLFQFLTGSSPFNGPNEYLIFQNILKLNYEFPSDFDANAKNLVENLLKLEPLKRLGSGDTIRYSSIQSHEFFQGINFDELCNQQPPCTSSELSKLSPTSSQVPDHFEPGFNPRVIAERILRSEGDLPWGETSISETNGAQVTLMFEAPLTPEPSLDNSLVQEKPDSATSKTPSNRCYCC